jgi:hypothetical protein
MTVDRRTPLLLAILVVLVVQGLVVVRGDPPHPLPPGAPAERFAAGRAIETLRECVGVGDGEGAIAVAGARHARTPRSAAHKRFRDGIESTLRGLGYEVTPQTIPPGGGRGFAMHNLYAERPGTAGPDAPIVLLLAHHDSVVGSPGIADDGAGVATLLETARWLTTQPPSRNAVGFLFTDGEETGLYGARAFVAAHAAFARVAIVLNFEARGVSGPSMLFETFGGDRDAIAHYAAAAPRPSTSSLFATVYREMPNDTDLTVFGQAGKRGLNFAFIGGAQHYHQPTDDFERLDHASVQHHGDHATAMVSALANVDFATFDGRGDAVFFDVLGWFVLHAPQSAAPWFAAVVVLLLVVARRRGRPATTVASRVVVELAQPVLLVLGAAAGYGLAMAMTAIGFVRSDFPDPLWPPVAVYWVGSVLGLVVASLLVRRRPFRIVFDETWLRIALIGAVLAFVLPGASYLFLVPAAAAAVVAIVVRREAVLLFAQLAPIAVAAVVWLQPLDMLPVALGARVGLIFGCAQAMFLSMLLPACVMRDRDDFSAVATQH